MVLYSNAFWKLSADFEDFGEIAGDSFVLECMLDHTRGIGARLEGKLGDGDKTNLHTSGNDRWVRENWESINGVSATLTVSPDIGTIIGYIGIGLLVAGTIIFFLPGSGDKKVSRCDDDPQCIEFSNAPPE